MVLTSNALISVGETTQKSMSNPGGSWTVSMITTSATHLRSQLGDWLDLILIKKEGFVENLKVKGSLGLCKKNLHKSKLMVYARVQYWVQFSVTFSLMMADCTLS